MMRDNRDLAAAPGHLGVRFALYAVGGSAAGITGFGTLWLGIANGRPTGILLGLALVVTGLLFAGVSLAAGMLASRQHRLRVSGSLSTPPGR